MPTNPMVVTLDHFNDMRTNFQQHYFLSNCNSSFGGQDIQISWSSFYNAVHNFMTAGGCAANAVALRFVLCYDTNSNALYLRMQICTMTSAGQGTYNLVTSNCAWYVITNGSIATTTVTDLYDQNYLDNFYYCDSGTCSANTVVNLASDTSETVFVRNLVLPWGLEVQKVYTDDGQPNNATICFAAVSPGNSSPAVTYPHSIAVYLRNGNGVALLDNTTYTQPFKNKAADFGTICPPNCNVYILQ